jgi:AraC-like DNA-binding protein
MEKDIRNLTYGDEDSDFLIEQVHRTEPFARNNHFHSNYEIFYLFSGERSYFIKDRSYRVAAGDLVFINKYEVHKTSDLGPLGHERIVINFSDSFLGEDHFLIHPAIFSAFQQNTHLLRLKLAEQAFMQNLLHKLTKEVTRKETGYESYVRLLLIELLLFAARLFERNEVIDTSHRSPVHQKVTEIVKHINERFHEPLSLTELSETFYISPFYLSRTFKAVTGFTLIEYLNLTRIKEAQRLLKETGNKVIDISEAIGFDHLGHFDRIFKKITKMTPMSYRKMHMN